MLLMTGSASMRRELSPAAGGIIISMEGGGLGWVGEKIGPDRRLADFCVPLLNIVFIDMVTQIPEN